MSLDEKGLGLHAFHGLLQNPSLSAFVCEEAVCAMKLASEIDSSEAPGLGQLNC